MCIIIAKMKPGKNRVNIDRTLRPAMKANPDGGGVTILGPKGVTVLRSLDYDVVESWFAKDGPIGNNAFVFHLRWATRGAVELDNCHPFPMGKRGWLFSNGTIDGLGSKTVCDTKVAADLFHSTPAKHWEALAAMTPTRIACVLRNGGVHLFGNWIKRDGFLYSKEPSFTSSVAAAQKTYKSASSWEDYYRQKYPTAVTPNAKPAATPPRLPLTTSSSHILEPLGADEAVYRWLTESEEGRESFRNWTVTGKIELFPGLVAPHATAVDVESTPSEAEGEVSVTTADEEEDLSLEEELDVLGVDVWTGFGCAHVVRQPDGEELVRLPQFDVPKDELSVDALEFVLGVRDPFKDDDTGSSIAPRTVTEPSCVGDWAVPSTSDPGRSVDMPLLAVYGTLKLGKGNHVILDECAYVGTGKTVNRYRMISRGIPYVYDGDTPDGHQISVEVYRVTDPIVRLRVDRLEGIPHHYNRKVVDVLTEDGVHRKAWMYFASFNYGGEKPLIAKF